LELSLTLASNAPTVTPALQRHLDLHWALLWQAHDELDSTPGVAALAEAELAQFHKLYEEYEMNLLRENDAPMSLSLALPSISIPEFNGEYLDWPRFHDLFLELVHNKPYSASQKLHILQSSLRGVARNVLTDAAFSQGDLVAFERKNNSVRRHSKNYLPQAYRRLLAPTKGLT